MNESPLRFGVLRVHHIGIEVTIPSLAGRVSIAFRRSPRSPHGASTRIAIQSYLGLHCLSAFTAFSTGLKASGGIFPSRCLHCPSAFTTWTPIQSYQMTKPSLHCLSAFSAFTTRRSHRRPQFHPPVSVAFRRSPRSPLEAEEVYYNRVIASPLAFGVLCVHHERTFFGTS